MLGAGAALPLLPGHAGLPCPLRTLTGVPCPICGMSTSVEATVHGHLVSALQANPAGPFAVLAALVLLVHRPTRALRVPTAAVVMLLLGMWVFELHRFALI
jgi:Protein of unknown function (DUF2752)